MGLFCRQGADARTPSPVEKFVSSKFSDTPDAVNALTRQFSRALSQDNVQALTMTLSILSTRAGTLLLTGYTTAFVDLSVADREKVLQGWKASKLLLLRKAFRGFVCEWLSSSRFARVLR